ncbi:hypothetical protein F2Q69_00027229 [Brassica cretica]|uniref:RNase H type-1 domain-containing protein n=1 Tax=Brassica cretica TaxID=69181 RepID=A0A8S9RWJ0_BRACR|nr:hypothetical protein F2Q69_00027229 [Brassica cretica]
MVLYKGQTKPTGTVSSSGYAKRNAYIPFEFNSTEYDTGYIDFFSMETRHVKKAREEIELWLLAQNMESGIAEESNLIPRQNEEGWRHVDDDELKCNIGMKWSKKKKVAGVAWVLSNVRREVLPHSLRGSKDEVYSLNLAWAIESMLAHKCLKVHFSFEGGKLVNDINRPNTWPSFKFKVMEISRLLSDFLRWKVAFVPFEANRGARLIADSAALDVRFQSYVARGFSR